MNRANGFRGYSQPDFCAVLRAGGTIETANHYPELPFSRAGTDGIYGITAVHFIQLLPGGIITFRPADPREKHAAEQFITHLSIELAAFYSKIRGEYSFRKRQPVAVNVDALSDQPRRWLRGKYLHSICCCTAMVQLVDLGTRRKVVHTAIYPLDKRFAVKSPCSRFVRIGDLARKNSSSTFFAKLATLLRGSEDLITIEVKKGGKVELYIEEHDFDLFVRRLLKEEEGVEASVGTIVHADGGEDIAVVPYGGYRTIKKIQKLLWAELRNLRQPPNLALGAMNAVLYNGGYFRGIITEIHEEGYRVWYRDYGNCAVVQASQICGISAALQHIPSPAICCDLADVPKGESMHPSITGWLRKFAYPEKQCLYYLEATNGYLSKPRIYIWDDSDQLISGKVVFDWALQQTDGDPLFMEENVVVLESPPLQQGYQLKLTDMLPYHYYQIGDSLEVQICAVWPTPDVLLLFDKTGPLADMSSEITEQLIRDKGSHIEKLPRFPELPGESTVICAKFKDGKWYRAAILEHLDADSATVYYVDYGNREAVNMDLMRPLPKSLAAFPPTIITAVVDGITAPPGGFTKKHVKRATDLIEFKQAVFRISEIAKDFITGDAFLVDEKYGRQELIAELFCQNKITAVEPAMRVDSSSPSR